MRATTAAGALALWTAAGLAGLRGQAPASLTGQQVMERVDAVLNGGTQRGVLTLTVVRPSWERTMRLQLTGQGDRATLIRISDPPKDAGTTSLRIGGQMWNYFPRVEKVIRVAPSMLAQSWMGSDVTNDDMLKVTRVVRDYTHTLVGQETVDGEPILRVTSVLKPDAPLVWTQLHFTVRARDFVPVREEFLNEENEVVKVMTFHDVRQLKDRPYPMRWEVRMPKKESSYTVVRVEEMAFNLPVDERLFTLQSLKATR